MGQLGILQSFVRFVRGAAAANGSEATCDTGGGAVYGSDHFSAPGDDGHPLPGDYVALVPGPGTGRDMAVGYADPANAGEAAAGEKRIYSRDPATGAVKASIWLKADGSAVVTNGLGTITLEASGDIDMNGATIDTAGNLVATSISAPSVLAAGLELAGHTHGGVTTGGGVTGPNQ